MNIHATKVAGNLNNKYRQNLVGIRKMLPHIQ